MNYFIYAAEFKTINTMIGEGKRKTGSLISRGLKYNQGLFVYRNVNFLKFSENLAQ